MTSDHSHSALFTGYPDRSQGVLGYSLSETDQTPFTNLLYGTGGANNYQYSVVDGMVERADPTKDNISDFEYSQQAAVSTDEVTHGGTDVLVYAKGPMSHLFNSVHEQTYVAYVISYAMQIGLFAGYDNLDPDQSGSNCLHFSITATFGVGFLVYLLNYFIY